MTLNELRKHLESYRRAAETEATALKDSYHTLGKLESLYRSFDETERSLADQVFAEWALSHDEGYRFDALAFIDQFRIATALPALHKLARRLATSRAPGAPYELKKLDRILNSFGTETRVRQN